MFDFFEDNAITCMSRQTSRSEFEEYLAYIEAESDFDRSGDEDSDSEDDTKCQCEDKLNEIIKMLKPNKKNNLSTINEEDEDDEEKGCIRVKQ